MDTEGAEKRLGLAHAVANYTALGLYTGSWLARRRGKQARGVALALAGSSVLTVGGWLGGHLSYALGVGVDTTAFQQLPTDWVDVAAESDVTDSPAEFDAAGVPVLLVRDGGQVRALADRCTHRGAPLHEGEIKRRVHRVPVARQHVPPGRRIDRARPGDPSAAGIRRPGG